MPEIKRDFNLRYFLNTRRFAAIAAGMAVVSLILIGAVSYPQVIQSIELYGEMNEQQEQIALLNRKVAELGQLSQSPLVQQSGVVNKVLPSRKPLLELLTALSATAGQEQVQISGISLSPGKLASASAETTGTSGKKKVPTRSTGGARSSSGAYDVLNLELTATGNLRNVTAFLTQVERIAPLTTVTGMSLSKASSRLSETVGEPQFAADLDITAYFFTQPVSQAITAPIPELSPQQQQALGEITSYFIPTAEQQRGIQDGGLEDLFGVSSSGGDDEGETLGVESEAN